MHDGSLQRLEDVIDFYSRGGRPNQHLDVAIEPLQLTVQEKHGLVAFLRALSGTIRR
jgi:cytochrome c peroxidase